MAIWKILWIEFLRQNFRDSKKKKIFFLFFHWHYRWSNMAIQKPNNGSHEIADSYETRLIEYEIMFKT